VLSRVGHGDQKTRDGPSLRPLVGGRNPGEHAVRAEPQLVEGEQLAMQPRLLLTLGGTPVAW
jgi:hypothetical protein